MTQWYYADRNRQRQGPVEADALAALFRRNAVGLDTLLWRDGMTQWQALGDFAEELGLLGKDFAAPVPQADDNLAVSGADDASATAHAYVEPATPYAPPNANVAVADVVHHGGEVVYAGFWKRYAASFIDGMVLGVIFVILFAVFGFVGAGIGSLSSGFGNGMIAPILFFGIYAVAIGAQAAYFTWMHTSGNQATLGKMAVGIKVTDLQGHRISTGKALGRWAGLFFFGFLSCNIVYLVSAFMAGLTERKQAVHDMASGTLVVDKWAFTAHPERQRRELGAVTIVMIVLSALFIAGYIIFYVIMMAAVAGMGR
jgi:uncharacterized RDD family membrane protein YckC